ncbi:MAG: YbjQ family protein, partial [Chromatiaceae bacterium]|nr:YbjQ family protein [Candidatus Thioaporhodococcus sediminis]
MITLTTAQALDGYRVTQTLEVITAECVFGMNFLRDFFSSFTDFFGGRSGATQKVLKDARKTALEELRKEAAELGANAVIGVRLDYSEFSGGGKSML